MSILRLVDWWIEKRAQRSIDKSMLLCLNSYSYSRMLDSGQWQFDLLNSAAERTQMAMTKTAGLLCQIRSFEERLSRTARGTDDYILLRKGLRDAERKHFQSVLDYDSVAARYNLALCAAKKIDETKKGFDGIISAMAPVLDYYRSAHPRAFARCAEKYSACGKELSGMIDPYRYGGPKVRDIPKMRTEKQEQREQQAYGQNVYAKREPGMEQPYGQGGRMNGNEKRAEGQSYAGPHLESSASAASAASAHNGIYSSFFPRLESLEHRLAPLEEMTSSYFSGFKFNSANYKQLNTVGHGTGAEGKKSGSNMGGGMRERSNVLGSARILESLTSLESRIYVLEERISLEERMRSIGHRVSELEKMYAFC
jgi:hypothetical protein